MSVDVTLAVAGIVAGSGGAVVAAALCALQREAAPQPGVPSGGLARILEVRARVRRTSGRVSRTLRRPVRAGDYAGDDLVAYAALAFAVCALLVLAAVGFAGIERATLRTVAVLAVVVSCLAAAALVLLRDRLQLRRALPWIVLMFAGDAGLAAVPLTFSRPLMGEGRFDDLARWLPRNGGLWDRARAALKIWNFGLVFHVLAQAIGFTMLLVAAIGCTAFVLRSSLRVRARSTRRSLVGASGLVVAGAVLASGALAAVPYRVQGSSVWAADAANASVTSEAAPPVALQSDRAGHVSLLLARCGRDRILALQVNGVPVGLDLLQIPATLPVSKVRLSAGAGPVTVRLRTTRTFTRTVMFGQRPAPREFLPARSGVTAQQFGTPGFAC